MANLDTLPAELKTAVISQISRADKFNLSKTCKALYHAAQPAFYHTIILRDKKFLNPRKAVVVLNLLSRTLSASPRVAGYVRRIELPYLEARDVKTGRKYDPEDRGIALLRQCKRLHEVIIYRSLPFANEPWPLPARLTVLRFWQCAIPPRQLDDLLRYTPNLRVLEYEARMPLSTAPLDCTVLRQALQHVQSSLTDLVVRYDLFDDQAEETDTIRRVIKGNLGSLREFSRLKSLLVPLEVLLGQTSIIQEQPLAEILPASLRHLTFCDGSGYATFLHWEGRHVMSNFKTFLAGEISIDEKWNERDEKYNCTWIKNSKPGWRDATPQLREFVLEANNCGRLFYRFDWNMEEIKELEKTCKEQGIKFAYFIPTENESDYQI